MHIIDLTSLFNQMWLFMLGHSFYFRAWSVMSHLVAPFWLDGQYFHSLSKTSNHQVFREYIGKYTWMYKYLYITVCIKDNIEVVINTLNQPNIQYWELIRNYSQLITKLNKLTSEVIIKCLSMSEPQSFGDDRIIWLRVCLGSTSLFGYKLTWFLDNKWWKNHIFLYLNLCIQYKCVTIQSCK